MSCSSDTSYIKDFAISVGPHYILCSLKEPRVRAMISAFFFNNRETFVTLPLEEVHERIKKRFEGALCYGEKLVGIEFEPIQA